MSTHLAVSLCTMVLCFDWESTIENERDAMIATVEFLGGVHSVHGVHTFSVVRLQWEEIHQETLVLVSLVL